jgi:hypothetical protein
MEQRRPEPGEGRGHAGAPRRAFLSQDQQAEAATTPNRMSSPYMRAVAVGQLERHDGQEGGGEQALPPSPALPPDHDDHGGQRGQRRREPEPGIAHPEGGQGVEQEESKAAVRISNT